MAVSGMAAHAATGVPKRTADIGMKKSQKIACVIAASRACFAVKDGKFCGSGAIRSLTPKEWPSGLFTS
jgi:hypothetical protein